jgi:hypothetical protein
MSAPWPWYIAGPAIGLFVPLLLIVGNRLFGVSSNLRHLCAACAGMLPGERRWFRYDWKSAGLWNLWFAAGILAGGSLARLWPGSGDVAISAETVRALSQLGIQDFSGFAPPEIFSWSGLTSLKGLLSIVGGGFLVGFGTAYAGGCTSGHAISGLADLQLPSLIATMGFFAGGLIGTHVLLPWILQ